MAKRSVARFESRQYLLAKDHCPGQKYPGGDAAVIGAILNPIGKTANRRSEQNCDRRRCVKRMPHKTHECTNNTLTKVSCNKLPCVQPVSGVWIGFRVMSVEPMFSDLSLLCLSKCPLQDFTRWNPSSVRIESARKAVGLRWFDSTSLPSIRIVGEPGNFSRLAIASSITAIS